MKALKEEEALDQLFKVSTELEIEKERNNNADSPVMGTGINSISFIKKKESLRSEGKFMGSLDLRDALTGSPEPMGMGSASLRLHHNDALASVRIASRKLEGFEEAESSEENESAIMEVTETISRDYNEKLHPPMEMQTPNL